MPAAVAFNHKGGEGPKSRLAGGQGRTLLSPETPAPQGVHPLCGRLHTGNARVSLGPLPELATTR